MAAEELRRIEVQQAEAHQPRIQEYVGMAPLDARLLETVVESSFAPEDRPRARGALKEFFLAGRKLAELRQRGDGAWGGLAGLAESLVQVRRSPTPHRVSQWCRQYAALKPRVLEESSSPVDTLRSLHERRAELDGLNRPPGSWANILASPSVKQLEPQLAEALEQQARVGEQLAEFDASCAGQKAD